MTNFKKILILFFSAVSLESNAQSALESAFVKSYQLETVGKYSEAANSLIEVYETKSYEMNLRLGYLKYMEKAYTESQKFYSRAISTMPFSIEAKLGIVYPLSALNDWNKVTATYKEILAIDPQNSTVNYRMGLISYNGKDYNTAYSYLEKVVNLYPFSYDGLILFAWTNLNLAKYKEAKLLFERVLLLSPSDASAKEGLSLIK